MGVFRKSALKPQTDRSQEKPRERSDDDTDEGILTRHADALRGAPLKVIAAVGGALVTALVGAAVADWRPFAAPTVKMDIAPQHASREEFHERFPEIASGSAPSELHDPGVLMEVTLWLSGYDDKRLRLECTLSDPARPKFHPRYEVSFVERDAVSIRGCWIPLPPDGLSRRYNAVARLFHKQEQTGASPVKQVAPAKG